MALLKTPARHSRSAQRAARAARSARAARRSRANLDQSECAYLECGHVLRADWSKFYWSMLYAQYVTPCSDLMYVQYVTPCTIRK